MQHRVPRTVRFGMLASGAIALLGLDQRIFWLGAVFKTLTTVGLFFVLGEVDTLLKRRVRRALWCSLVGDVALLGETGVWFQAGLAAFLVAQLLYVFALAPFAVWGPRAWTAAGLTAAASATTVILSLPEAVKAGVGVPVGVYACALTAMLATANATVGGRLTRAHWAAWGGLLFYCSDTSIALLRFVPGVVLPHPVLFTTGIYWLGQYGLVVAARIGVQEAEV